MSSEDNRYLTRSLEASNELIAIKCHAANGQRLSTSSLCQVLSISLCVDFKNPKVQIKDIKILNFHPVLERTPLSDDVIVGLGI